MEQLSVTDYAKLLGVTRQAILLQIKEKRLPKNVTVKKIGNTYSLSVRGQKKIRKRVLKCCIMAGNMKRLPNKTFQI
jgi:predicted transcriptional regulator